MLTFVGFAMFPWTELLHEKEVRLLSANQNCGAQSVFQATSEMNFLWIGYTLDAEKMVK